MVAFLPAKKKFPTEFLKPVAWASDEPCDAYILVFTGAAGLKHGRNVEDSKRSSLDFITSYKHSYPDDLKRAEDDLKKVEFNYEEAKKLKLIERRGKCEDAEYNCITKNDVVEEVKKLAGMRRVNVGLPGSLGWFVDGTEKYIKVSVTGVVHWFSFRTDT
ncbi:unnamed protein product [Symbiodinium sp. CCMP2456]|nr:unnamed protein product [Symbiodinium sp. CCMP2456]